MSFSSKVKAELLSHISTGRHCRMAELAAMIAMSGEYRDGVWTMRGENTILQEKITKLTALLDVDINTPEGRQMLKLTDHGGYLSVNPILVERNCCKQAFIRGAFLATGSLTDPEKGYHFEIVCDHAEQADMLARLIRDFSIEPKQIQRKKYYVVYIKDGSMIVDLLNIMGAHVSLMDMENIRILKDMRNSVNRRVNCETANLNKVVSAAVKQMEDITYIEQTKGLKYLPERLREIASLRMEEPDTSLVELGKKLNPPLGKSGVNHRLKKISDIANELRRNQNDQ